MAAFLAVIAVGIVIGFAIAARGHGDRRVRHFGRAAMIVLALGLVVEVLVNTINWPPVTPGLSFVVGAGLALVMSLPGMLFYFMPR